MAKGYEAPKKIGQSKFIKHVRLLIWKSIVQRRRRWVNVTIQNVFAGLLFLWSVFVSQKVFLESVQATPEPPLTYNDIVGSLVKGTIMGYAPNEDPFVAIMETASEKLGVPFITASSEQALNEKLYSIAAGTPLENHVIWVIWKPKINNVWKFSIRCTELADVEVKKNASMEQNRHLRVGFLAVQMAVSEAIVSGSSNFPTHHRVSLVAMPMSPLMREREVRSTIAWLLIFYAVAFIPPVMEISALVVTETNSRYKRALRMRDVDYSSMYLGWLAYAFITALPNCLLGSLALIIIFRWILLFFAVAFVFTYVAVTVMFALIMAMFHTSRILASVWSALLTLLQLSMAELLVHHGFVNLNWYTFALHILLPPLGLVHGFNSFALLQTGRGGRKGSQLTEVNTIFLWLFMVGFYFGVLMLLQRTIGQERAIGGQVSWKSIIFKKAVDTGKLRVIHHLTGKERDKLQEVDEMVAKGISFRHVSKSIMGAPVITDVTFDTYRGEYTMFFADRTQEKLLNAVEDLITGLSFPDKGSITVLGRNMAELPQGKTLVTMPHLVGYCHQAQVLVSEFTVLEQLQFFTELSLWDKSSDDLNEYSVVHIARVVKECDLEFVRHMNVGDLDGYYQAQLCWAIAILLEPQMIYVTHFTEDTSYVPVLLDKILRAKGKVSILKMCHWTQSLEYADRIFFFDKKKLAFGGTPAYMFFKHGREYRIRVTVTYESSQDPVKVSMLMDRMQAAGAKVRSHLGSLLIMRLPTQPTATAASLIKDLTDNSDKYGITTLHVSLPDCDEICRRAKDTSRLEADDVITVPEITKEALKRLTSPPQWQRVDTWLANWIGFKVIAWKFIAFYVHYRLWLIITMISAVVTGCIIGISLSLQLKAMVTAMTAKRMHGEKMFVEAYPVATTLVLKADNSNEALEIATAYSMSHTNMTKANVAHISYTALPSTESATEYLILRAIDSPQHYVYMYAYGLSVLDRNNTLWLSAMYSPVHQDSAAAARSLARLYMALLRHYTGLLDADIEVTDDPLELESTGVLQASIVSPLFIQFMLIVTMSHITLLPSKEYGLIRHTQAYSTNFSPCRYWFFLMACDLIMFWFLVLMMSSILITVTYTATTPTIYFNFKELVVMPFILVIYGLSSVPQAYLFSLGPNPHLNTVIFIVFNVVFGEATVISQILYGNVFDYAQRFLSLSPQYNVANAFIRMSQIFVYNSECTLFIDMNLCAANPLHKCCPKCGIMEPCFKRITYLSRLGVLDELVALLISSIVFMSLLMVWEYQGIQRLWTMIFTRFVYRTNKEPSPVGAIDPPREMSEVLAKKLQMKGEKREKNRRYDTYGGLLLAYRVSLRESGKYIVRDVSFGVARGEAVGLTGLQRHGRIRLCEVLAGYRLPSAGEVYAVSKWQLTTNPHLFASKVGLCTFESVPLPPWMTVYDALLMVAVLRGVPKKYAHAEVRDYIDALEMTDKAKMNVCRLPQKEMTRLNFAAVVIGAPPVLVLDECTAQQKPSVVRSMYFILHNLRKRGHAIVVSSFSVEHQIPLTNHLAILLDGYIYDIDHIDNLVDRSQQGYTVVVNLNKPVDVEKLFTKYFKGLVINDTTNVLANVQIFDDLDYAQMFGLMEHLVKENPEVKTYVIASISMDFVYNKILNGSKGLKPVKSFIKFPWWDYITDTHRKIIKPIPEKVNALKKFEHNYDIVTLRLLPWSVIFKSDVSTLSIPTQGPDL